MNDCGVRSDSVEGRRVRSVLHSMSSLHPKSPQNAGYRSDVAWTSVEFNQLNIPYNDSHAHCGRAFGRDSGLGAKHNNNEITPLVKMLLRDE